MKYYSIAGTSINEGYQNAPSSLPEGYIEMVYERPTPEHVAQKDGTWAMPETPLEQIKEECIVRLKQQRDALEVSPISYNGNAFDYDDKSRDRMRIAREYLVLSKTESKQWTTADNTSVSMTVEDFNNITLLLAQRGGLLHYLYNQAKELVATVTTLEELEQLQANAYITGGDAS